MTHPNGRMRLDGRWTTYGKRNAEGRVRKFDAVILPVGRWRLVGTDIAEHLWAPRGVSDPQRRGVTILGRGGDDEIEAEAQATDPIDLCDPPLTRLARVRVSRSTTTSPRVASRTSGLRSGPLCSATYDASAARSIANASSDSRT